MVNASSVRNKNKEDYKKVIQLRKEGLSYSEIRKIVPLAKSTLHGWLNLAGLTLTAEHLNIQKLKRLENWQIGVVASNHTRKQRFESEMNILIEEIKPSMLEPLFVSGLMLYEAEGCKAGTCRISNSDHKLIRIFIEFIKKYMFKYIDNIGYRLYIHETRGNDLGRIINFWANHLNIDQDQISITWKKNKVTAPRENPNYVGQMDVSIYSKKMLIRKLQTLSGIIINKYCGVV